MVEEFFADLENNTPSKSVVLPKIRFDSQDEDILPAVSAISSFQNVQYTAMWMILKELAKPDPLIRIVSAAENEDMLVTVLKSCLIENDKAGIQHIFRMRGRFFEGNRDENDNYNFKFLTTIFTLCMSADNYRPYYYYVSEEATLKEMPFYMYSFFIATSDHVLECSQDYQNALLINDRDVVEFEIHRFDSSIKNMKPLIRISRDQTEISEQFRKFTKENTRICNVDMEPFVAGSLTEDMIRRTLDQNDSSSLSLSEKDILQYFTKDIEDFTDKVTYYMMSENGLCRFLENGIINGTPNDSFRPLQKDERDFLIREYVRKSGDKTLLLYDDIYDHNKFLFFYVGDKSCLLFYRKTRSRIYNFCINEESICSVFRSYVDNLPKIKYYPPEKTADRILEILEEYR